MSSVKVNFEALGDFFNRDANVILAMVFGSGASGTVAPGSDLDVAVLFHQPPPPGDPWLDYYLRVCDTVPEIEVIDLVNLNRAHVILALEALQGRIVSKNDAEAAATFFSRVCREYEDIMASLAYQRSLRHQMHGMT
jgi:predicted nucleotidyltransferase